jgi:glucose dehydrogenase
MALTQALVGSRACPPHLSPLKQITAGNLGRLGLAWSYDTQSLRMPKFYFLKAPI